MYARRSGSIFVSTHQKSDGCNRSREKFKDEIVPVTVEEVYVTEQKRKTRSFVVDTDEGPRKDTTVEGLAKLTTVFAAKGSVTAGNSSQTSDGAAFVTVMRSIW